MRMNQINSLKSSRILKNMSLQHISKQFKVVKWQLRTQKLRIALVVLTALCIWGILLIKYDDEYSQFAPANLNNSYLNALLLQELEISVLHDKSSGCDPPPLDPFAAEVLQFSRDLPKVVCEGTDWVQCYLHECRVIKEILLAKKDVFCIYKDILYVDDFTTKLGPPKKVYGSGIYKLEASDHVKVACTSYEGLVPSRWFGYKAGFRPLPRPPATPTLQPPPAPRLRPPSDPFNVLIVVFDSTSHGGFVRRMPKSYDLLTRELKAVVMNKYNILGDGTTAALFPLLTGKTPLEHKEYRKMLSKEFIDEKILLFHVASTLGYRTAYFENMPWIGTFQTRFNGFERQPAHHYLRAMLMLETEGGRKWWHGVKGRYCIGDTPQYAMMFNLTRQFYDLDGLHFSFTFIGDISHDDFNMITTADDELVDLLRSFQDRGDTMLMVMGDHGTRYNSIRETTFQGKLEELLPFMAIRLPPELVRNRPDALTALVDNANALTTPFDIHTTLLDVMGAGEMKNSTLCRVRKLTSIEWVTQKITSSEHRKAKSEEEAMQEDLRNNVLENKGKGCIMPKLDPFDEDVLINEKKLPTGVYDLKDVSCVYRDIVYVGNTTQHLGPARTLNDGQIYRLRKSDFVHVACIGINRLHFSSLREVPQLTLEDHLPLMALVLPDRLKQIRPDATTALAANLDVLTTPFDIHSTLTDVLAPGTLYRFLRSPIPRRSVSVEWISNGVIRTSTLAANAAAPSGLLIFRLSGTTMAIKGIRSSNLP
ncbi:hypothetical protein MSG28_015775 [Choristoneura fumiferana]|uniref:Uncharacterized protein n=1 Tax=Choristoneura fumiferana TaxID=7141 RepID=A0ACC0KBT0_CHOFU|nr:hypothetical protein MSG28_015775 [Choristoneura fumiferana]